MDTRRTVPTIVGVLVLVTTLPLALPASAASPDVVINQVYGGGGNSSAPYQSDFVELFNRGSSPVNLNGWSLQYAPTTGTTWQKTDLGAFTLQPGQYYLVQGAAGTGCAGLPCGVALPSADVVGSLQMNSNGKLALVTNTTLFADGTACPVAGSGVRDFLGWGGSATCFETETGAAGTNALAVGRRDRCADTDNNLNDFEQITPNPRNSTTPLARCSNPPPSVPDLTVSNVSEVEGDAGTGTFSFTVNLSAGAPAGGVTFDVSTVDGSASAPDDYASRSLTGQTIPAGAVSYDFDVAVNGDSTFEPDETFFVRLTNVSGANVSDGEGRGEIVNDDEANVAPRVTSLAGPIDAVRVGTIHDFEGTFTDENAGDGHTARWDWGDGTEPTDSASTGTDNATHSYARAGFYTVEFTVTDSTGMSDSATMRVVVYDPQAGHVTGSGTYDGGAFSLSVGYRSMNEHLTGSATLTVSDMTFVSTQMSWLVVSGSSATFKAFGALNGAGGYTFLATLSDGGSPATNDRFRFRVKDAQGDVVYDSQAGDGASADPTTQPTGGNITVHNGLTTPRLTRR